MRALLTGVQRYLTVVLICVSLMNSKAEYLFMYLKAEYLFMYLLVYDVYIDIYLHLFFGKNVYSGPLPIL